MLVSHTADKGPARIHHTLVDTFAPIAWSSVARDHAGRRSLTRFKKSHTLVERSFGRTPIPAKRNFSSQWCDGRRPLLHPRLQRTSIWTGPMRGTPRFMPRALIARAGAKGSVPRVPGAKPGFWGKGDKDSPSTEALRIPGTSSPRFLPARDTSARSRNDRTLFDAVVALRLTLRCV